MNFIIVSFFLNLVNNFKIMDLKPVLENKSLYPPGEGRPRLGTIDSSEPGFIFLYNDAVIHLHFHTSSRSGP